VNGASLALRPERISVVRATGGAPAAGGLAGEILTAMVVGPAMQWIVRVDDGQEVLVRHQRSEANGDAESLREGDRVHVEWARDAALNLGERKEEER
jgi:outer membrane lipoprotein SlyB